MPDNVPAAPAPDAVAPPTPVAPTPPAPSPTPEKKPSELASRLFTLLTAPSPGLDDPPKPKEKPAAPPPPAAAPEKKEPAAPADEGGIKRRQKPKEPAPEDKPPPIPKKGDLAPKPADTPPPVQKPEQTDAEFEKELIDEERAQLDDARAAEKHLGEKYKGYGTKMTAFLKENTRKVDAVGEGTLDQEEYEKWHKTNLPKIGVLDLRRLMDARAEERFSAKFEPQLAEDRHSRWVDTETPKIKAKGNEVYNKLANSALPDEVVNDFAARAKGLTPNTPEYRAKIAEIEKDYALEFEIADRVISIATSDIEEFHRLTTTNPVTKKTIVEIDHEAQAWDGEKWVINPNPTTERGQQHARVLKIIKEVCEQFKATGGAELKKDGKWFVTRDEWFGMEPNQRGPFWSFSNEQIAERALLNVKPAITNVVAQEREKLEKRYGFRRTIAPPSALPPPVERMPGFGAPPAPRSAPVAPGGGAPQPSIGALLASKLTSQPAQM